jgi:hypothetical protein
MGSFVWALAAVLILVLVLLAAALLAARARPGPTLGGTAPRRFPKKVRASARAHPEWGALDYNLFEAAPGKLSWYSSLLPWHVPDVDRALRAEFPTEPPRTITDATAHIGADSANFLKVFPGATVTAVEVDPAIGAILRRNAARVTKTLGVPSGRFRVVVADARDYFRDPARVFDDLVYFDPPWQTGREVLRLGRLRLSTVVADVLRRGARVALVKLPRESDLDAFDRAVGIASNRYPVYNAAHGDRAVPSYHLLVYRA